jgi:hypothetical protein
MQRTIVTLLAITLVPLEGATPTPHGQSHRFVSECADVIAIRNSVEEYVREVKHKLPRTSKEYILAEDAYSEVWQSYEQFITALLDRQAASSKAADTQRGVEKFFQLCRSLLQIDHLTDLEEPHFSEFVGTFSDIAGEQPKSQRPEWIRKLQAELAWKSWDRIR